MELKPGTRLRSAVCATEIIIVKAPSGDVDLRCGGAPVVDAASEAPDGAVAEGFDGGTLLGKRYVHDGSGMEILCTKGGDGALSVGDDVLPQKDAKPLPASD